jgi:formylglycine-generating enzyme required for sulfatase activity
MRRRLLTASVGLLAVTVLLPFALRAASADVPVPTSELQEDEPTPDDPGSSEPSSNDPGRAPSSAPSPSGSPSSTPSIADGEMVHVPGATYAMGSSDPKSPPNERPRHVETVTSFFIDRTEVTVGAYRRCVESRACARPERSSPSCTYDLGDPRLPVSCVHWRDAEAYCRDVGKRLPRESEWELAARGPKGGRYPWRGAYAGCFLASTLVSETTGRTCTKGPSRVGAHAGGVSSSGALDMAGNVEEWTSDWYVDNLALGAAPASGASHVLRGGGWLSAPSAARSTARNWGSALEAGPNVGFRCAKTE